MNSQEISQPARLFGPDACNTSLTLGRGEKSDCLDCQAVCLLSIGTGRVPEGRSSSRQSPVPKSPDPPAKKRTNPGCVKTLKLVGSQRPNQLLYTGPPMLISVGVAVPSSLTRVLFNKAHRLPDNPGADIHDPERIGRLGLIGDAGWSSPVARQAHNLKVVGSNPAPATKRKSLKIIKETPCRMQVSCRLNGKMVRPWYAYAACYGTHFDPNVAALLPPKS